MVHVFGVDCGVAGSHLHHLVDPPARGIRLQPEFAVRRARVQAQAAMDAPVEIEELIDRMCSLMEIETMDTTTA